MEILEFMDYPLNIKTVWGDYIWLPLDQMLRFLGGYVTEQVKINTMMMTMMNQGTYLTVVKI